MVIVTFRRDRSRGVRKSYHKQEEVDAYIEALCENLEEEGWELTEDDKSEVEHGLIKCVNKYEKYSIEISWRTLHS